MDLEHHGVTLRDVMDAALEELNLQIRKRLNPKTQSEVQVGQTVSQTPDHHDKREDIATQRKTVIEPILESKGWSILDWANESGVAYHTDADYLAGKTKSYRSTRVKMAKALGISIQQFPR